jgi:hypothetical protein
MCSETLVKEVVPAKRTSSSEQVDRPIAKTQPQMWYDFGKDDSPARPERTTPLLTAIHSFEGDAESVLQAMGLSGEILEEVCRRGLAEFLTATPYHPSNAAGLLLYLELVQSLRQKLVPTGWELDEGGLALTFNETLGIAIAVRSGDAYTGDSTRTPSFKYPESTIMHDAIGSNARQLGLFDGVPGFAAFVALAPPKRVDFNKLRTWWLLHYVDTAHGVMRAELSLPVTIGDNGETDQWKTRIILTSIPFNEEPQVEPAGGEPGSSEIDVPVRKKA